MFKSLKYLLGAGLIAGATTASAAELPPEFLDSVMQSCRPDYHRICSFVVPGGGRVARCLLDHETELAPDCLKAIKLAYAMEVCMPDYRRFCNGVPPGGGQIASCLAGRMEALAPECQRVISANAPYAIPGRERYGYNVPPAPAPYGGYGGPAPYGGAYRYGARPNEDLPYQDESINRDRPEDDGYADEQNDRYAERPYSGGEYPDRGYSDAPEQQPGPGYQQPGPNYPPPEEGRDSLK